MPWFKVDDGFAFHRKVITAGNKAVGLWVRAGSWSAHQLTDGHIPSDVIFALGGTWEDADKLVSVELWDAVEDGFQFRGWHDYQPSRESVIEERERARKRKQAWRDARTNADGPPDRPSGSPSGSHSGTGNGTPTGTTRGTDSVGSASPTRPDPTRINTSSSTGVDAAFDRFWKAYPRKVGKTAAVKSWKAAIKNGADPDRIADAAEAFRVQSATTEKQYIPHPSTWLSNGRYDDEPEQEQPEPSKVYWTPPTPPREVADDPEAYSEWYAMQAAQRGAS